MNDIDLIPADYRAWLKRKHMLGVYAASIVALAVAIGIAGAGLKHARTSCRC